MRGGDSLDYHGAVAGKTERLGNYELLNLLATGGMAEIYLARQTGVGGFERLVVVKKILPHLARQKRFVQMFFDEARIAAQLSHPNIVQIIEIGQQDDDYFLAMEYLEGESLGYLVREARRQGEYPPVELAAGMISQVCDGLDYAHRFSDNTGRPLNIVHRDVSPHNIIVLFSGGVKLVDFGIAKAASNVHQTHAGTLKGKFAYMSPEQVRGEPLDARSDLFSLGVALWELLCGRRLFKREGEAATMQAVLGEAIPPPAGLRPQVPAELSAVAERALQRDPGLRYQAASEMAAALREYLRQASALAGPAEISAWANQVLGQRAGDKRRLLALLEKKGGDISSFSVLKPDTEESFPSSSMPKEEHAAEAATQRHLERPELKSRLSPAKWLIPPLVALLAVVAFWVLLFSDGVQQSFPPDGAASVEAAAEPPAAPAPDVAGAATAPSPPEATDAGPDAQAPLAKRSAMVWVESSPAGCRVEVDGIEVPGVTPLSDIAVEADTEHRVTVTCPGRPRAEKKFTAATGESVRISFDLPAAEIPGGFLSLDTSPWSEIYLGRRKLGLTPLIGYRLPAGEHLLKAVNEKKGLNKEFKVKIRPGKTTRLRLDLAL